MSKQKKDVYDLIIRYVLLIFIVLIGIKIIYFVFTPLTIYPSYLLTRLYSVSSLSGIIITFSNTVSLEIVGACVAGSAYLLLIILNLTTSDINLKKRILMLFLSYFIFLFFNIIRIFVLGYLVFIGSVYFDVVHSVLWYGISTIFVVALWFFMIYYFKIKSIPVYSDLKFLYQRSSLKI